MELPGKIAARSGARGRQTRCPGPRVRWGATRPGVTWANPGMLRGYVFDRRSGQRHGLPAAIPIHPAP